MLQSMAIVILSTLAAVVYGIIHDQITARICVEYFTVGHPPVFNTESPTLLGLGWGVIATWWVGFILGVPLAWAARYGERPKLTAIVLIRPLAKLLLVMACCAALAGVLGCVAAKKEWDVLYDWQYMGFDQDTTTRFIVDSWIHSASYLVAFLGGIVLIISTWRSRQNA